MWKLSFDCTPRPPFYWFPQCTNEFNECEKCDLYCHCTCSISWLDCATLSLSVSKAQTSRAIVLLVCSIGNVIVSSKLETKPFMTLCVATAYKTPQRPSVYAAVNVSVTVSHHFQFSSFLIFFHFPVLGNQLHAAILQQQKRQSVIIWWWFGLNQAKPADACVSLEHKDLGQPDLRL